MSGCDSTSIKNENCLKSLFTKKLSNLVRFIEFEAKPPNALYKEAGKFLVLNTIDVITFFFFTYIFALFGKNQKSCNIVF